MLKRPIILAVAAWENEQKILVVFVNSCIKLQCHKDVRRLAFWIFSQNTLVERQCVKLTHNKCHEKICRVAKTSTTCWTFTFTKRRTRWKTFPSTEQVSFGLTTTEHAHHRFMRHENEIIQFMFKSEKMSKTINNKFHRNIISRRLRSRSLFAKLYVVITLDSTFIEHYVR